MTIKNTATQYGTISRFLHWTIFGLVLALLLSGYFMGDIPQGPLRGWAHNTHKLIGLLIFVFMLLRIVWFFMNRKPDSLPGTPSWQRVIENMVHFILYALLIMMPLSGWLMSTYSGRPPILGSWVIGLPVDPNTVLKEFYYTVHATLAVIIILMISVHVLAALYHYIIKKNDIFRRM